MSRDRADHLTDEEIVVADDHDLDPARRAAIDAHLGGCAGCRDRLAESRAIGRLLRAHSRRSAAPSDAAWDRLAPRLAAAPARTARWSRALAALLVIAVVGLALLLPRPRPDPPMTPASVGSLPFAPAEPARLPLDLSLVGRSTPAPDRLELRYRSDAGLALLVVQQPAAAAVAQPTDIVGSAGESTITVRGTAVHLLNDPWPQTVAAMDWRRSDVRFDLLVTDTPPGGLPLSDAEAIASALIATQEDEE